MLVTDSIRKNSFLTALKQNLWVKSLAQEFTFVHPEKLKERNMLFKIQAADSRGKLAVGIADVWAAANQRKGKLLIGERDYLFPAVYRRQRRLVTIHAFEDVVMPVSDAVDATIEKVLNEGGAIEFVENGKLKKYKRMVLIEQA